jgi:WD40 repeat protein
VIQRILLALSLLLLPFSLFGANERIIVDTGHTKSVRTTLLSRDGERLYTGSDDGTVRIWDTDRESIVNKLQISHLPVVKIAVDPEGEKIALIETDRINTYHLSVWNLRSGKELFSHKLTEVPLFLSFSPRGSYLIYGLTEFDSLNFLDPDSGESFDPIKESLGIVSHIYMSDTEKTLITYSPTGKIRYWSMENGSEKISPRQTERDLLHPHVLPGAQYMTGIKNDALYLINMINGESRELLRYERIYGAAYQPASDELVLLVQTNSVTRFVFHRLDPDSSGRVLSETSQSVPGPSYHTTPLAYNGSRVFFADEEGSLYAQTPYRRSPETFARSLLLPVSDIHFSRDHLYLATSEQLILFSSPAFSSDNPENKLSFELRRYENPLDGQTGLVTLSPRECILYPMDGDARSLYRFEDGSFTRLRTELTGPVMAASRYNQNILLLEESGKIRIIDPDTGREEFNYSPYGLRTVEKVGGDTILAALKSRNVMGTPLLKIDTNTGETVPVRDRNLLIFELAYDEVTGSVYSIGFQERRGSLRSVLKQHQGRNYERVTPLISYPGEDDTATIAIDESSSRVYTSLGYGQVHMYAWNGFTTLERVEHIPRDLYVHKQLLYSLNNDSSISVWDTSDGSALFTIYLFDDYSWAVVTEEGRAHTSSRRASRRMIRIREAE